MKWFTDRLKKKSAGFYVSFGSAVVAFIAWIMYLSFGVSSQTLVGGVVALLLIGFLLGIAPFFYEGVASNFLAIANIGCLVGAFGRLFRDSIGDFTDFMVQIQLFGEMENAGMRLAILILIGISMIAALVACFLPREKKNLGTEVVTGA